jgi:rare lipoprotein A
MTLYGIVCFLIACGGHVKETQSGYASYYHDLFQNKMTASGEMYDTSLLTAAHRDLPLGQHVRVIRIDNGKAVEVRINDRGPFNRNRLIDLSKAAAKHLAMLDEGVVEVKIEILE